MVVHKYFCKGHGDVKMLGFCLVPREKFKVIPFCPPVILIVQILFYACHCEIKNNIRIFKLNHFY